MKGFSFVISNLTNIQDPSDRDVLYNLFCRVLINSYAIMDPERRNLMGRVGTVVYVEGSAHDHSCAPNSVQLFDGTKLQIRALRDFDTKVEPPLIHYIDLKLHLDERRSRLRRQYYFECECPRCVTESSGSPTVNYDILNALEKESCKITTEFVEAEKTGQPLVKSDVICFASSFYEVRRKLLPLYERVYGPTHPFVRHVAESVVELKQRLDLVQATSKALRTTEPTSPLSKAGQSMLSNNTTGTMTSNNTSSATNNNNEGEFNCKPMDSPQISTPTTNPGFADKIRQLLTIKS